MTRTTAARATIGAEKPTAAAILALVQGIERVGLDAPAAIAFKAALRRKGTEANASGGLTALDALMAEVAEVDPSRADARTSILRAAWGELLPGSGGRSLA